MILYSPIIWIIIVIFDRIQPSKFQVGNKYDSDDDFIKAVLKVQQEREDELTEKEAESIKPWKIIDPEDLSDEQERLDTPISVFELKNKQREERKKEQNEKRKAISAYDAAIKECVGGSAAEVECVWSMAGHVLTDHRSSLSPLVFEMIMYLKYNARLWNLSDVVEANKRRRNESSAAKKRIDIQTERLNKIREEVDSWEDLEGS